MKPEISPRTRTEAEALLDRALQRRRDSADGEFGQVGAAARAGGDRGSSIARYDTSRADEDARSERMRVLVVGSGGREHALGWALAASPLVRRSCCARRAIPASPRRPNACRSRATDIDGTGRASPARADRFRRRRAGGAAGRRPGRRARGGRHRRLRPERRAAALEGSKGFTKDLCAAPASRPPPIGRFRDAGRAQGLSSPSAARRSWSRPTAWPPARA